MPFKAIANPVRLRRGTWAYYWINPGVLARLSALLAPGTANLAVSG